MIYVISYYSKNLGTTDYFLRYLKDSDKAYLYLRHPLTTGMADSELIEHSSENKNSRRYKSYKSFVVETLKNMFVNNYILYTRRKDITSLVAFGSMNAFSLLLLSKLLHKEIIFWGVDYSKVRFENPVLNKIYHVTETLSSILSTKTVQPTHQQEEQRIKFHRLPTRRSLVIPNGFNPDFTWMGDWNKKNSSVAMLYIGSLSKNHGLVSFITNRYVKHNANQKLYIFGDGEEYAEIVKIINNHKLESLIILKGSLSGSELMKSIKNINDKLIGIAPYPKSTHAHTYFGDSLKIKEYMALGLPFISSDTVSYPSVFDKYGFKYNTVDEMNNIIDTSFYDYTHDSIGQKDIIQKFTWKHLISQSKLGI